jgi:hypothetical protein
VPSANATPDGVPSSVADREGIVSLSLLTLDCDSFFKKS